MIQNNWQEINSIIAKAAQFAGRPVGDIRIVGVAKKQPEERVKAAVEAGLGIIGENYAQEFLTRRTQFQDPKLKWHFVGHLQSNKAKLIVGEVELIHSVDRLSLAEKIGQVAQTKSMVQEILLEINLDEEKSKSGALVGEAPQLIEDLQKIKGIRLCGLMAMPSLDKLPEDSRRSFAQLRELSEAWKSLLSSGSAQHNLNELSMGTTLDFRYAVEEGATLVRLGTSLFGSRN